MANSNQNKPEESYSTREIQLLFHNINERMERHKQEFSKDLKESNSQLVNSMDSIVEQFKNLNGSVKSISKWKEQVVGGSKVAAYVLAIIVLPLVSYVVWQTSTIDIKIINGVESALSKYDNIKVID